jgi:hypothetical protein
MRRDSVFLLAGLMGLSTAFAGCSDSGPSEQSSADARGVIASAADCVSFGTDAVKACAAAIEEAINAHEASTTSFTNLQACERDVGVSKCERAASGRYRARLSAFMVTIGSTAAHAEPLYPVSEGGVGFQKADKSKLMAEDRSTTFSSLALSVAEMQAAQGGSGGGSGY